MMRALMLAHEGSFWMPVQASNFAEDVDRTFHFIYYVALFFFIIIAGAMFAFIIVYRRRSEDQKVGLATHNTPLEIAWSVGPAVLLAVMFWWGFKGFMRMRTPVENSYEVRVNAQKWSWEFVYPNGVSDSELHIPVDRPIRLVMFSADVLHACFIPAFRVKRDVVPGRYSDLRFIATKTGEFPLLCAEYCGTSHSDMRSTVHVYDEAGFQDYLKTADPFYLMTKEEYPEYIADPVKFVEAHKDDSRFKRLKVPVEMGQELYNKKGCKTCHTLDGSANTGPTWKGLFGRHETFTDGGGVTVDENYIRESVLDPGKHVVQGFQNVMPKTTLSDPQIDCLIAFIKTLKD